MEGVAMEVEKGSMTVVGRFDAKKLRDRVADKTRKNVDLVVAGGSSNNNNGRLATDDHLYPPRDAGTLHGYGFHQCAGTDYFGIPAGHQMQELLGWGAAQTNLAMWCTEEPHHAMVPVHYPSAETGLSYMDTTAALGVQAAAAACPLPWAPAAASSTPRQNSPSPWAPPAALAAATSSTRHQ